MFAADLALIELNKADNKIRGCGMEAWTFLPFLAPESLSAYVLVLYFIPRLNPKPI